MNNIRRKLLQASLIASGVFFCFMVDPALAEDGAREWRPIYDFILRWINFGILAYFLVRFAGPLLVDFLNSQKSEIQSKIERAQKEKDEMLDKVREAKESLETSGPRLEEIKQRIIEEGEHRKQEIIDEANEQSRLMMKNARQRIDNQIRNARKKMADELLDMAMELAVERLPREITDDDDNKLIQNYLNATIAQ